MTFYLIIISVILLLYVFMTKEKYFKTKETFGDEDDDGVDVHDGNDGSKSKAKEASVVKKSDDTDSVPKPKQHKSDNEEVQPKIVDFTMYHNAVQELNENVKKMLETHKTAPAAQKNTPMTQPSFAWY